MFAEMEAVALDQAPTPKRNMSTCVEGGSKISLHMDDYRMSEPAWMKVSHQSKDREKGGICRIDDIFSRSRQDSFSAPGLSIGLSLIGSPQALAFLASNLFIPRLPSIESFCKTWTGMSITR